MGTKTFYIHIGVPKTGTSLIQKCFYNQRQSLKKIGLLYPETALRGFGHHDIAFLLNRGFPEWAKPVDCNLSDFKKSLMQELMEHNGDVLLSSENFYLFPQPRELHLFLTDAGIEDNFNIKIIIYLRRQDEALISWYNQRVKAQGYTGSFQDSLEDSSELWCYHRQLSKWIENFGKNTLITRIYDENWKTNSGLVWDFCSNLPFAVLETFRDTGLFSTLLQNVNTSINRDLLEFQRLINRLPITTFEKRELHQELMELSNDPTHDFFDRSPLISNQNRKAILSEYNVENSLIAKEMFNLSRNDIGILFGALEESSNEYYDYPGLTKEKINKIKKILLKKNGDKSIEKYFNDLLTTFPMAIN